MTTYPAPEQPAEVDGYDRILRLWGKNIRAARGRLGMTGSELAAKVGVSRATVSRWERGHFAPTRAKQATIATIVDDDPHELFPIEAA